MPFGQAHEATQRKKKEHIENVYIFSFANLIGILRYLFLFSLHIKFLPLPMRYLTIFSPFMFLSLYFFFLIYWNFLAME